MKKDLTKNNLEEVNEHALASGVDEENHTRVRSDISLSWSLISKSIRSWWKISFQEKEEEWPRLVEMVRFYIVTIL